MPPNQLTPAGPTGCRLQLLPEELRALGDEGEDTLVKYCHYDFKTGTSVLDYYTSESFYKLVFSADEGTEVHGTVISKQPHQVAILWVQLAVLSGGTSITVYTRTPSTERVCL